MATSNAQNNPDNRALADKFNQFTAGSILSFSSSENQENNIILVVNNPEGKEHYPIPPEHNNLLQNSESQKEFIKYLNFISAKEEWPVKDTTTQLYRDITGAQHHEYGLENAHHSKIPQYAEPEGLTSPASGKEEQASMVTSFSKMAEDLNNLSNEDKNNQPPALQNFSAQSSGQGR